MNLTDPQAWYPIEIASRVLPGQITLGLLFGHELALWRTGDGALRVWDNRCPHRSVRLTLGLVIDDQLACRYHGWRYGGDGRCTGIPANPGVKPPAAACVKTYRHLVQDGVVWASLDDVPLGRPPRLPANSAIVRSHVLAAKAAAVCSRASASGFEQPFATQLVRVDGERVHTLLLQPMDDSTTALHHAMQRRDGAEPHTGERVAANDELKPLLRHWTLEAAIAEEKVDA